MWFAIGFASGVVFMCFLLWFEKKHFIFSDLLFDLKNISDKEDISDILRDIPMSHKEWKKRNGP